MSAEQTCYRHPDRVTGLSCSECGRPICTECMTMAPVGIRCPEHSGQPQGVTRMTRGVRRAAYEGVTAKVTRTLIAINVGVYLAELAQGAGVNGTAGSIFTKGVLYGPAVANGGWYRLVTNMFLHYGPFHLLLNMYFLWIIGPPLERILGSGRFLILYLVSGLAGSAGSLVDQPLALTVGASGAIFGLLGAAFVLERQHVISTNGTIVGLIVINLVFSFVFPHIAIGGHIGGLIGGALATLAMSQFGRVHAAYGRLGIAGIAGMLAVGVGAVAIAYFRVRGYA
jgi:membrane associated rhomboid family serine protease